ncbi:stress enhanced protein 2, chloroplastic [Heracleum sosnowskyi]|uniref:Stress enhanced protein 2, chloroplastic n=1 Tax=Heracleum sosnowskyi TaxID=360622 RepID=A0AAD8IW73_9APIA|nr:stress enhanced protein 2, chloroplastic [Heracleum sosnowskyi]
MALAVRPVFCQLNSAHKAAAQPQQAEPLQISVPVQNLDAGKIVLQPRLCTLRSYASDRAAMIKSNKTNGGVDGLEDGEVSRFFGTLSEYIESTRKSQDFEIISGRLAMIVFAGTIIMESMTGNSTFRKMEVEGIAEAAGACVAAITCAATFAYFSSARNRVGRIFTIGCNTFIDSLIDQIIDGLFYESELSDWSDEI